MLARPLVPEENRTEVEGFAEKQYIDIVSISSADVSFPVVMYSP